MNFPEVFQGINVLIGCVLVLLFLLIVTSVDSD